MNKEKPNYINSNNTMDLATIYNLQNTIYKTRKVIIKDIETHEYTLNETIKKLNKRDWETDEQKGQLFEREIELRWMLIDLYMYRKLLSN
jgi:hypothetical protein